mmetsp:Transcript_4870/g.14008  ORF Transcript_4870/g.14008 Transcript_4870/m.14008 type:complete len:249 (+) Transcript_4870:706-1452(+)
MNIKPKHIPALQPPLPHRASRSISHVARHSELSIQVASAANLLVSALLAPQRLLASLRFALVRSSRASLLTSFSWCASAFCKRLSFLFFCTLLPLPRFLTTTGKAALTFVFFAFVTSASISAGSSEAAEGAAASVTGTEGCAGSISSVESTAIAATPSAAFAPGPKRDGFLSGLPISAWCPPPRTPPSAALKAARYLLGQRLEVESKIQMIGTKQESAAKAACAKPTAPQPVLLFIATPRDLLFLART